MSRENLENYKINVRIKLSALWTAVMFCYIYGDYFELYVPNKVEGLINGQNMLDDPLKLFIATFVLAIPALMIFISLVANPKLTKWLSISLGIFFTFFTFFVGISSISKWHAFYMYLSFLESIITTIIVFHAWKWPKI
ncbi:DUF6326 family protein [Flavobacterium sp.]|uniref:DUF6326 family protein n=1 Tax=Flavobacterium sp. TaxID=239 RepID=UPI00262407D6|nr:DUF6326 family protein [Flavobacterium sp.]